VPALDAGGAAHLVNHLADRLDDQPMKLPQPLGSSGVLDAAEKMLDLTGWVSIDNRSGKTYRDAKLKVVAGEIHRARPEMPVYRTDMMEAAAMMLGYAKVTNLRLEERSWILFQFSVSPGSSTIPQEIELWLDSPGFMSSFNHVRWSAGGRCRVEAQMVENQANFDKFYAYTIGQLGELLTRYGKIGIQICWDNFFPEGSRILALKGAKIIFSPTAAAFASQRRWETVISSNAIANGVYIFRVNRVGSEEKQDFYGRSFCISPEGELLDKPTGMKDSIALVEVDLKNIEKTRKEWPFFRDRRPDAYEGMLHGLEDRTEGLE
jgi:hypothetical protein